MTTSLPAARLGRTDMELTGVGFGPGPSAGAAAQTRFLMVTAISAMAHHLARHPQDQHAAITTRTKCAITPADADLLISGVLFWNASADYPSRCPANERAGELIAIVPVAHRARLHLARSGAPERASLSGLEWPGPGGRR